MKFLPSGGWGGNRKCSPPWDVGRRSDLEKVRSRMLRTNRTAGRETDRRWKTSRASLYPAAPGTHSRPSARANAEPIGSYFSTPAARRADRRSNSFWRKPRASVAGSTKRFASNRAKNAGYPFIRNFHLLVEFISYINNSIIKFYISIVISFSFVFQICIFFIFCNYFRLFFLIFQISYSYIINSVLIIFNFNIDFNRILDQTV